MDSLYVVMPAYNEEQNIEYAVKTWYSVLDGKDPNSRLVVADSGSSDRTHEILSELQLQYPQLVVLSNTEKQHGPKVFALYDYAICHQIDYVFQTDSDGQTDPAEFEDFWIMRNQYEGIFGYRKNREDGRIRAFVEKVVCLLLHLYFGVDVPDANAPFRLMKVETVKKYLYNMKPDYELPNIMMTTYFVYYKEKNAFMPITFKSRRGGGKLC